MELIFLVFYALYGKMKGLQGTFLPPIFSRLIVCGWGEKV